MSPAVNVTLEEVPFAILEAVKARILANRRRLEQPKPRPSLRPRAQFRRFGASSRAWRKPQYAAAPGATGYTYGHAWLQGKDTPRMDYGVEGRGITAANPIGNNFVNIDAVFATQDVNLGRSTEFTLASGDGRVRTSWTFGLPALSILPKNEMPAPVTPTADLIFPPPYSITANVIHEFTDPFTPLAIPVGGGGFLLLCMHSYEYYSLNVSAKHFGIYYGTALRVYPESDLHNVPGGGAPEYTPSVYDFRTGGERLNKCFYCNNSTVREVAIPAKLQTIIDAYFNPPYGTKSEAITPPWWSTGYYMKTQAIASQAFQEPANTPFDATTGMSVFAASSDPSVFGYLSSLGIQFTDPSNIKAFPADGRWAVSDTSRGVYTPQNRRDKYVQEWFNEGIPAYYGIWNVPGEQPEYEFEQTENGVNILVNPARFERDDDATLTPPQTRQPLDPDAEASLFVVWDWDDPDYCRAMCLALGFTEADLKP